MNVIETMRDAIAERHVDPSLEPVMGVEVVGIAQHHGQRLLTVAQGDADASGSVGVGNDVESGRLRAHVIERERRQSQRKRQARYKLGRRAGKTLLQQLHELALSMLALHARPLEVLRRNGNFGIDRSVHWMLPASSKIGMYMRTTISPIAMPSTAIRTGSNARVNQSTKRAISSS